MKVGYCLAYFHLAAAKREMPLGSGTMERNSLLHNLFLPRLGQIGGLGFVGLGEFRISFLSLGFDRDWRSFTPGNLDNRAGVVSLPLLLTAGNRLDSAVNPRRLTPEEIHILPTERTVELRRYDKQVDVAPGPGRSRRPGSKQHSETLGQPRRLQGLQIMPYGHYHRLVNHGCYSTPCTSAVSTHLG